MATADQETGLDPAPAASRPGRSRRPSAEAFRKRLLDAAADLLSSRGLDRVNSNQIARAAGVGIGTFYSHFPDKYAIHQALVLQTLEEVGARVEEAIRAPARDRETPIRRSIEAAIDYAQSSPHRFRAAFGHEPTGARGRPGVGASPRPLERRLRGLQVQGRLLDGLDPAVGAKGFTSMQTAVILWWLEDPSRAEKRDVIETLFRLHPAIAGAR